MKRTVLLLRHAKSDWDADHSRDHDRPLAPRGREAAGRIGRAVARAGLVPDLAVTSTARRARDTLDLAAEAGVWRCPVERTDRLYEAAPEDVLERIRKTPAGAGSLMLVGHEPTWSLLTEGLVGGGNVRLPTAALVRIDLAVARWEDVRFGDGVLRWIVTPKLLAALGVE